MPPVRSEEPGFTRLPVTCPVLGLMISAVLSVNAQVAKTPDPVPPNAWMKIPTLYSAHDGTISAALRSERDRFWDSVFPYGPPLTPETAIGIAVSEGAFGVMPEVVQYANRAAVIATFTRARSIMTASGLCVYTEVTFRINEVFESTNPQILPSTDITVTFAGGTITTPSGRELSFLTHPRTHFIQPLRRYLLLLTYRPAIEDFGIISQWDVSDGVVRADDNVQISLTRKGKSALNGLTMDQLHLVLPLMLKPPPIPDERRTDSYAVYSAALAHPNTVESLNVGKVRLVEQLSDFRAEDLLEGAAPRIPEPYRAGFSELLKERSALQRQQYNLEQAFATHGRYVFISKPQGDEFRSLPMFGRSPEDVELFRGAGDMLTLGNVYFDSKRTLAAVYTSLWCGVNCQSSRWRIFTANGAGGWDEHPWILGETVKNDPVEWAKPGTTWVINPKKNSRQ